MKDYYDKAFTYASLRAALNRCCRNVRWKDSVAGYELHAPQNTHKLIEELRNGTYRISKYQRFTIHELKTREIVATRIRDRQVQMALCRAGLYDDITEHFIYDNCACQTGKGTDFALKRMKVHLIRYWRKHGRDGWVLQCDVKHFFPNTPHDTAKAAVAKRVGDERVQRMVFDVIDSFGGDRGIGLGSQISQLIELAVLDDLDHFIKERLRIKGYIRYMDDFWLLHPDKAYLEYCRNQIAERVSAIGLELNRKTSVYPIRQGVRFLQWRFLLTPTGGVRMRMDRSKVSRERHRLKKLHRKELAGEVPTGTTQASLRSWEANAKRGDSFFRIKRMEAYYQSFGGEEHGNDSGTVAESGA